jgi:hypothetical protein
MWKWIKPSEQGGFVSKANPAQGWFLFGESVESNTARSSKRIRLSALF